MSTKLPAKKRSKLGLFRHDNGSWCKKMKGRHEYFGSIKDDPTGEKADSEYLDQKDNILAGRRRRVSTGAPTVLDLVEKVISWKHARCLAGDLSHLTLREWYRVCRVVLEHFGSKCAIADVGPDDFESLNETQSHRAAGPQRKFIIYVRSLFNFAYCDEQRLIDKPVLFGPSFRVPKQRKRFDGPSRLFTPDELHKFLSGYRDVGHRRRNVKKGWKAMRAMILLGINCGLGNNECATLTFGNLDLEAGWHTHGRTKTGTKRRCPFGTRRFPQ